MTGLKYVGASPSTSNSVVTLNDGQKILQNATSNLIDHRQRARDLSNSYLTRSEASSAFSGRVTKTQVNQEKTKYLASSDIGNTVASLSGGKIPLRELPSNAGIVSNLTGVAYEFAGSRTTISGTSGTDLYYFSVPDPGYDYHLLCFGNCEVQGSVGVEVYVTDSTGVKIAGGSRSRDSTYSWVRMAPLAVGSPNSGVKSFRLRAKTTSSGTSYVTNWKAKFTFIVIPA